MSGDREKTREKAKQELSDLLKLYYGNKRLEFHKTFFIGKERKKEQLNASAFLRRLIDEPNLIYYPGNNPKDKKEFNDYTDFILKHVDVLSEGTIGAQLVEWIDNNAGYASSILPYPLYQKLAKKNNLHLFYEDDLVFKNTESVEMVSQEKLKKLADNSIQKIEQFREIIKDPESNFDFYEKVFVDQLVLINKFKNTLAGAENNNQIELNKIRLNLIDILGKINNYQNDIIETISYHAGRGRTKRAWKDTSLRKKAHEIYQKLLGENFVSEKIDHISPLQSMIYDLKLPHERLYDALMKVIESKKCKGTSRRAALKEELNKIHGAEGATSQPKYEKMVLAIQNLRAGGYRFFTKSKLDEDLNIIIQKIYNKAFLDKPEQSQKDSIHRPKRK